MTTIIDTTSVFFGMVTMIFFAYGIVGLLNMWKTGNKSELNKWWWLCFILGMFSASAFVVALIMGAEVEQDEIILLGSVFIVTILVSIRIMIKHSTK